MRTRPLFRPLMIAGFALVAVSALVAGNAALAVDTGFTATAQEALGDADLQQVSSPDMIAANIIRTALSFVGVIFLLLTIYAGFLWMTAAGEPDKVDKAKKLIVSGIIGMAVIFGAYIVTDFVFTSIGAGLSSEETAANADAESFASCLDAGETIPDCPAGQTFSLVDCACETDDSASGTSGDPDAYLELFNQ